MISKYVSKGCYVSNSLRLLLLHDFITLPNPIISSRALKVWRHFLQLLLILPLHGMLGLSKFFNFPHPGIWVRRQYSYRKLVGNRWQLPLQKSHTSANLLLIALYFNVRWAFRKLVLNVGIHNFLRPCKLVRYYLDPRNHTCGFSGNTNKTG